MSVNGLGYRGLSHYRVEPLEARQLLSASPHMVGDLNTAPADGDSQSLGLIGERILFTQNDGVHGTELWRSNGTGGGTYLLKDLTPGPRSSTFEALGALDGKVLFGATTDDGASLYCSDGTTKGTKRLLDLEIGGKPARLGGSLYFFAADAQNVYSLWRSDGTAGGTQLVHQLGWTPDATNRQPPVAANGRVFFIADKDGQDRLWSTDGTARGTICVAPDVPDVSLQSVFAATENYFYFGDNATRNGIPSNLWRTDGRTSTRITEVGYLRDIEAVADRAYFTDWNQTLWRVNDKTAQAKQLTTQPTYLTRPSGSESRDQIFTGDGKMIQGDKIIRLEGPKFAIAQNGNFVFYTGAKKSSGLATLFRTDGRHTPVKLGDVPYPGDHDSSMYFAGAAAYLNVVDYRYPSSFDFQRYGNDTSRWYKIDIANQSVMPLCNVQSLDDVGRSDSFGLLNRDVPSGFAGITPKGVLYAFIPDLKHGRELWKSNGTATGTRMLRDVNPTNAGSHTIGLVKGKYGLYATGCNSKGELALWRRDLAGGDFVQIAKNADWGYFQVFTIGDADFVCTALSVWRTRGTPDLTRLLQQVPEEYNTAHASRVLSDFQIVGSRLHFTETSDEGEDDSPPTVIHWETDGFSVREASKSPPDLLRGIALEHQRVFVESAKLVSTNLDGSHETVLAPESFVEGELIPLGNLVFFSTSEGVWQSDGTAEGTKRIEGLSDASAVLAFKGKILVLEKDLLKSMDPRTKAIKVLKTFSDSAEDHPFMIAGASRLYFSARDALAGFELWTSDGTRAGTKLVKDIKPGEEDSLVTRELWDGRIGRDSTSCFVDGNTLYFAADDGTHGFELWKSDGTSRGTTMIADICPVNDNLPSTDMSNDQWMPRDFVMVGRTLFFSADDGMHGRELWGLDLLSTSA